MPDVAMLDAKIAEAEAELAKADTTAEKRRLETRKEDLMRMKRIEQIYVSAFVSSCAQKALTGI